MVTKNLRAFPLVLVSEIAELDCVFFFLCQHQHMIKTFSVSIRMRGSAMDLKKFYQNIERLFHASDSQVFPLSIISISFFLKLGSTLLIIEFMYRTNLICPYYWNGHDYCWEKWWPISCLAYNSWWTGIFIAHFIPFKCRYSFFLPYARIEKIDTGNLP